jgi:hypothetical protein
VVQQCGDHEQQISAGTLPQGERPFALFCGQEAVQIARHRDRRVTIGTTDWMILLDCLAAAGGVQAFLAEAFAVALAKAGRVGLATTVAAAFPSRVFLRRRRDAGKVALGLHLLDAASMRTAVEPQRHRLVRCDIIAAEAAQTIRAGSIRHESSPFIHCGRLR